MPVARCILAGTQRPTVAGRRMGYAATLKLERLRGGWEVELPIPDGYAAKTTLHRINGLRQQCAPIVVIQRTRCWPLKRSFPRIQVNWERHATHVRAFLLDGTRSKLAGQPAEEPRFRIGPLDHSAAFSSSSEDTTSSAEACETRRMGCVEAIHVGNGLAASSVPWRALRPNCESVGARQVGQSRISSRL